MRKIKRLDQLKKIVGRLRGEGRTVVWTNGCFDLMHVGHVRYLAKARKQGDVLVVGLNSDRSVRRLKGAARPVMPARERAEILAALEAVDYVIVYEDAKPNRLIRALRPEVHVKGGDYALGDLPEAPIVRAYGGKVVIVPAVKGVSTTKLIRKIAGSQRTTGSAGARGKTGRRRQ